jgi:hypothetical protein
MRDGCALLLRDKEYNDADSEQTRHERESKQAWVVVIKGTQQPQCASGADNRAGRVQHSLEAKGRPCVSRVTAARKKLSVLPSTVRFSQHMPGWLFLRLGVDAVFVRRVHRSGFPATGAGHMSLGGKTLGCDDDVIHRPPLALVGSDHVSVAPLAEFRGDG